MPELIGFALSGEGTDDDALLQAQQPLRESDTYRAPAYWPPTH